MAEFQEFPKMLYHPKTNAQVIVRTADEESAQLDAWGVEEPKIPLRVTEGGAAKPKAEPKARAPRTAKPKAAS